MAHTCFECFAHPVSIWDLFGIHTHPTMSCRLRPLVIVLKVQILLDWRAAAPSAAHLLAARRPRRSRFFRILLDTGSQSIARGVVAEAPDERTKTRLETSLGPSPVTPFAVDWKLSSSVATALPSVG